MEGLQLVSNEKGSGVTVTKDFKKGDQVIVGTIKEHTSAPHKYTIQKNDKEHIVMAEMLALNINHSCCPNLYIQDDDASGGFSFHAIRDIHAGEELGWDYDSSEMAVSNVFHCMCGADNCRGEIRGFLYINDPKKFLQNQNQTTRYVAQHWQEMGSLYLKEKSKTAENSS